MYRWTPGEHTFLSSCDSLSSSVTNVIRRPVPWVLDLRAEDAG